MLKGSVDLVGNIGGDFAIIGYPDLSSDNHAASIRRHDDRVRETEEVCGFFTGVGPVVECEAVTVEDGGGVFGHAGRFEQGFFQRWLLATGTGFGFETGFI